MEHGRLETKGGRRSATLARLCACQLSLKVSREARKASLLEDVLPRGFHHLQMAVCDHLLMRSVESWIDVLLHVAQRFYMYPVSGKTLERNEPPPLALV